MDLPPLAPAGEPRPPRAADEGAAGGVAVIGLACRFPGARDEQELWRNLRDGVESIRFFSRAELEAAGIDARVAADPSYVPAGGVLDEIEAFDAPLFGYSPSEAAAMDPQHRLFLETAWAALENAGHCPRRFDGAIGVYAGLSLNTYQLNNLLPGRSFLESMEDLEALLASDKDFLASRTSYKLGLTGPSMVVQTACSTSLVAVCQAAQSLLDYQCDMALAGGVSVRVPQQRGYLHRPEGILSPDGRCRPFDAAAGGTAFGNGVGIVVLRRLDEAIADGDAVRAVLRGWAVNNDGSLKVGFTAPSVEGHAEVVALALALAGIDASRVGYVEAHGTATPLGDPIEVAALTRAFRAHTDARRYCALGSVKSNIGHLDAAAGVAGLIKTVLALEHRRIPPTLHFESPNPRCDFETTPFFVNSTLADWAAGERPRCAGVGSLGIGGTNAHVVLEEGPPRQASPSGRPFQLLVLSARSERALEAATANLADDLEGRRVELADVAFSLQVGRQELRCRRIAVCRDGDDAVSALRGGAPARLATGRAGAEAQPVVFMFPGQGSQYVGMGRRVHTTEPVFRSHFERCAEILAAAHGIDLPGLVFAGAERHADAESSLEGTANGQPALFAVEYALASLFMSWGVRPRAMIGHSVGEYVAATLAGVFSLEDALGLVVERGRLMQELPSGSMLAVALPAAEVEALLPAELALAAANARSASVVSGPTSAVERFEERLAEQRVATRRLRTSHAFHSSMMDPILPAFAARVRRVALRPARLPWVSNVTGQFIEEHEATDPEYWCRHLRQPVLFARGLETLVRDHPASLLELGPGRVLSDLATAHGLSGALTTLPRCAEPEGEAAALLGSLGRLWIAGVGVDWPALHAGERRSRLPLPTYPFERQRHWVDPPSAALRTRGPAPARRPIEEWFHVPVWRRAPPLADAAGAATAQPWIVFGDASGLAAALVQRLSGSGRRVIEVLAGSGGERFERLGEGRYRLAPGEPQGYLALFEELAGRGELPGRVAHLWTVGEGRDPDAWLERGFYSLLFLAQALGDRAPGAALDVVCVSSDLQAVTGAERPIAEKAALLGPCRVMPLEYPRCSCRNIDVASPSVAGAELADLLLRELLSGSTEPVVALRSGERWVPELRREAPAPSAAGVALRQHGHYLITGGTGGLGLALAGTLARAVRARLTLISRSPLPPPESWDAWLAERGDAEATSRRILGLRRIEAVGGQVVFLAADVADRAQMRAALARAGERFGRIHGAIHAAGVAGGRLMQLETRADAATVLAPKVRGTRVLADLLGPAPDFLVLCSSIAATLGVEGLGAEGQASYCGANAFLLSVASESGAAERGVFVVAWDTWRDVGMAVETPVPPALEERRRRELRAGIDPREGGDVFCRILEAGMRRSVISTRDVEARLEPGRRGAARQAPAESSELVDERPPDAAGSVEAELARIWSETLGVDRVGPEDDFELGGQSLQAVTVFAEIDKRLGVRLPLATLFEAPTVARLASVVRAGRTAPSWCSLVPLKAAGSRPPLYLVSGLNLLMYRDLLRHLEVDQPAYGLQASGLDGTPARFTGIEEHAAHYLREIRAVEPRRPYVLVGKSAHGLIALEMARQLRAAGESEVLLIFLDTLAPDYFKQHRPRGVPTPAYLVRRAWQIVENQLVILGAKKPGEALRYVVDKAAFKARRGGRKLKNRLFPMALDRVDRAYRKAQWEYQPTPYPGPVLLLRARHQRPGFPPDPELGWGGLIGELEAREVPGYHASVLMEPRVGRLAEEITAFLDRRLGRRDRPAADAG